MHAGVHGEVASLTPLQQSDPRLLLLVFEGNRWPLTIVVSSIENGKTAVEHEAFALHREEQLPGVGRA